MPRTYTSLDGIIARAGRATEDPVAMTRDANETRLAKHIAEALKANPELTPLQAARAGRQLLRAEMARMAKRSAEVRAERAATA
jgi:hypothetical protein